jgi:thiol:disulfide interchange protein DsbA
MKRSLLLLPMLLLAACSQNAPATGETADAPAAGATAGGPSAAAQAAAASAAAAEGAQPVAPGAEADAVAADAPAPAATAAADGLVEGVDYETIPGGQPFEPLNGKVEVVEVFNYICPACARFEPVFSGWSSKAPDDVRVTYVPASFNEQWEPYARAYLVADAMGIADESHTDLFHAIHLANTLPGEGDKPDEAKVAEFYAQFGADPKQFLADMHSFSTDAKLKRARQFLIRERVAGTPTILVNGKYVVTTRKSYEDIARVTDALVARERAAR